MEQPDQSLSGRGVTGVGGIGQTKSDRVFLVNDCRKSGQLSSATLDHDLARQFAPVPRPQRVLIPSRIIHLDDATGMLGAKLTTELGNRSALGDDLALVIDDLQVDVEVFVELLGFE